MEELISVIKILDLCSDDEYFQLLIKCIKFIDINNIEFFGIYEKCGDISLIVPEVINDLTMSIAIHEAGHLYDYYKTGSILESEATALEWEFCFLTYRKQYDILNDRLKEIKSNPDSLKYKSIKKEAKWFQLQF
ncbi:MAG: hypothetical protein IKO49_03435 [Bacilli bacterium]|nr:hypothetical protein [Bacilli bacterium]